MKSETLVTTLTSLTTAMAVAAPIVVFGFLYVLQIQPQRAAAIEARSQLEAARYELNRQRLLIAPQPLVTRASALEEFDARTTDRVEEVTRALTGVLSSPSVGGVSNLSIETGAPGDGPRDSIVRVFSRPVVHIPITATFDARYDQIGRFFWNLRVLPTTFDLQSLELARAPGSQAGLMRARVSLLAFHRPGAVAPRALPPQQAVDVITTPRWTHDPFAGTSRPAAAGRRAAAAPAQPAPDVNSILVSTGRRVARVDGRLVRIGDRVQAGVIQAIEADAVSIEGPDGRVRRFELERPVMRVTRR